MTESLEMPDGPGWWAFEGYIDYGDETANPNDTERRVYEVVNLHGRIYAVNLHGRIYAEWNDGIRRIESMFGKWTRLTMPWEDSDARTS